MELKTKADKYFDGLLSKKERKEFEEEIKNNPEIKEYLTQRKILETRLSEYYSNEKNLDKEVKQDIEKYLNNYTENTEREIVFKNILRDLSRENEKNKRFLNPFILNLAAAIALLMIIGIGFGNHFIKNSKQKAYLNLYAQFFDPDNDFKSESFQVLGIDSIYNSHFESSNSSDLNDKFKSILRNESYDDKSLVYLSVLLMKSGDDELAISQLNEILYYASPPLSYQALWYYSLANLKIAEVKIATENLSILCKAKNEYSSRACELLKLIADK